ncbi:MAG: ATP-binding cassette domain-containing protein [Candidatus Lokiarchaeota archaeon]|nr:ATP-binding cassette domain-containing protein [Candidatus Lokiarchaeota archaeon]
MTKPMDRFNHEKITFWFYQAQMVLLNSFSIAFSNVTSMSENETLLSVEDLKAYFVSKKGYVKAVDGISFDIKKGECLGVLGESGCGKSSLALAIIGLFDRVAKYAAGSSKDPRLRKKYEMGLDDEGDRPGVRGSVIFKGMDLTTLDDEKLVEIRGKQISMIPQGLTHALNPQYSVGYQTGEPIEIHDEDVRLIELKKRVLEYLNLVRIADSGFRFVLDPSSFSGGEAQRILIAMSLISGPYLVIADEPTSALDVTIQRQIINVLRMVRDEFKVSLMLISHDAGVIAELADRVAVMYAGKLMEVGDAVQMFHHPGHPYTMGLMSSFPTIAMMRMKAGGKKPRLRGIPGDPPDLTELPSGCPFHPRCSFAVERCKIEVPENREVEPRHWIRCHRYEEIKEE